MKFKTKGEKAEFIIETLLKDLTSRRGLRQAWEEIDEDTQDEIKAEWQRLLVEII